MHVVLLSGLTMDSSFLASQKPNSRDEKWSIYYLQSKKLLAMYWYDKCDVYVISNIHSAGFSDIQRHGDKDPMQKPTMIDQYSTFIGGADRCEQQLNSYTLCRKSNKWWKKMFFRFIDLSTGNAFCLYKMVRNGVNNS